MAKFCSFFSFLRHLGADFLYLFPPPTLARFLAFNQSVARCIADLMASEAEELAEAPNLAVEEQEEEQEIDSFESEEEDQEEMPALAPQPAPFRPINPLTVSKRWKEYYEPNSRRFYYFDRVTRGVQWRKPEGFLTRAELNRPVSVTQIGISDWKVVGTLGGKDYYFNFKKGTTAWELPEDFNTPIPAKATASTSTSSNQLQDGDLKKRGADSYPEDILPEAKRRKLASDKPESFIALLEDTRETASSNFTRMLESHGVDKDAVWQEWQTKLAKDARFIAVASLAEKRILFESYVKQLAADAAQKIKKERDNAKDAMWKEIKSAQEAGKSWRGFDEFKDLFRPTEAYQHLRDVHADSIGDIYDDFMREESEKKKKMRAKRDFWDMLEEKVREKYEKDTKQDWLDFKMQLEEDPRYNRAQLSGGDRESIFEDFAREIRHSLRFKQRDGDRDQGRERERERDYRDDRSRDREREGRDPRDYRDSRGSRDSRSSSNQDKDKENHQSRMEDREERQFRALLAEKVKKATNASWDEMRPLLSKDPRFETQYIGNRRKTQLFEQHVQDMKHSAEVKFWKSLDQFGHPDFYLTWIKACDALAGTPALSILPSNAEREAAYNKWAIDKRKRAESDLKHLFQSTTSITSKTDLENEEEMQAITKELSKDSRWRVLPDSSAGWDMRRSDVLAEYIESLSQ